MAFDQTIQAEIDELKKTKNITKRAISPDLEEALYEPFPILDHGFVRVVDYMGNDESIVQAARVSYGKGTKRVSEDRGLIRYLMRHHHTTPFEMCEIKLHVKLPIFVARQWIRHRTANVNEYSARYSVLDREFYVPDPEHLAFQSTLNRQGREEMIKGEYAQKILKTLVSDANQCYEHYENFLNEMGNEERPALARELARINLPINFYTQWYWKIDLHNLFHFCRLRADSHAQYEIQAYAQVILDEIVKRWVPFAYEAFMDYRFEACSLSKQGLEIIKRKMQGDAVTQASSGLSIREWRELNETLGGSLGE